MIDTQSIRVKILDLAMRGQLTEHQTGDGSADDLYEEMLLEKQALIKAGKIKKEKSLPEIPEEEKPYSIPQSWRWVYLGELFQHNTGKALNSSDTQGQQLEYITTSNLYWNRFELDDLKTMPFTDSEIEKCTITKGDLLVCEGGDIGRSAIWPYDYDIRIQNHIHRLRKYSASICTEFYYYLLWLYKQTGRINGVGIGLQGFSAKRVHSLIVPLAPFDEAVRIVEVIREAFSFLETIDALQVQYSDNFTALKSKLIDAAIQGKLTEQLQEDGTAEELYQKIQAEKQTLSNPGKSKKEKNLLEISADDIPFSIPENWKWVRLGDLLSIQPSNGFSPKGVNYQTPYRNLTLTATSSGFFKPEAFKYVDISEAVAEKYYLKNQDILIQRSNSRELVGTSCIYHLEDDQYIYPDLMMRMHVVDGLNTSFIDLVLKSPYCRSYYQNAASGTSDSMPKVNQATVRNTLIPLPPINEQNRIIAKLEELLLMFE